MSTISLSGLRMFIVALLAAALVALPGCADVSQEAYERIEVGMSIRDVQDIMGTDGRRTEQRGVGISAGGVMASSSTAVREETFTWESGHRRIIVHVRDGIVTSKHKEGF